MQILQQQFPENEVRIYSYYVEWMSVFGMESACAKFTNLKLNYMNCDGQPNYKDWSVFNFGGWTTPFEKQYKKDIICGQSQLFVVRF